MSRGNAICGRFGHHLYHTRVGRCFTFFPEIIGDGKFTVRTSFLRFVVCQEGFILTSTSDTQGYTYVMVERKVTFHLPGQKGHSVVPFLVIGFQLFGVLQLVFGTTLPVGFPFTIGQFFMFTFFTQSYKVGVFGQRNSGVPIFLVSFGGLKVFPWLFLRGGCPVGWVCYLVW